MLAALSGLATVDVLCLSPGAETALKINDVAGVRCVSASLRGSDGILFRLTPKIDFTERLEALLGHSLGAYDLIVGRYAWGLCQIRIPPSVRTLVDLDDYRFRFSSHYGWSVASVAERSRKWLGHLMVRRTLKHFSGAFVASMRDFAEISKSSQLPACFLPNVAPVTLALPSPQPVSEQILFVGSLWYGPNAQGIEWMLSKVWPRVRKKFPKASLLLVGAASLQARSKWERVDGVKAPGFVDDLATAYARSMMVVVPIQSGGGSNIKVLEALQYEKPCVVSSFVASAFAPHLHPGVHFRVADTASQFVEEISEVLNRANLEVEVERIRRGHEVVMEHFLPGSFVATVRGFAGDSAPAGRSLGAVP